MARIVKNGTRKFSTVVGKEELLFRRLGLSVPEFYRLTPYQLKQTNGYVDNTYTKIKLKDGRVVSTRDAMDFLPRQKQAKSTAGLYGRNEISAVNISSIISTRTTYIGLKFHQVTFNWYPRASGGRITIRDPRDRDEYLVDAYMFCDSLRSWNRFKDFVESLLLLMINSQCKMVNYRGVDDMDRLDHFNDLFYKGYIDSIKNRLLTEREVEAIPESIEKVLIELDNLSFSDDDNSVGDNEDITTLLTMVKLSINVYQFTVDITKPLLYLIGSRYSHKPYMELFIHDIFSRRRNVSSTYSYKGLIYHHSTGRKLSEIESDFILGSALYEKLKLKYTDTITVDSRLIEDMPDNCQTKRIRKTLGLMRVVTKN